MQTAIPYMQIRGGSSKGVFFNAKDLPANEEKRDQVILAAMEGVGIGDPRQVDGLGGADSLTAKVGIISPPTKKAAHLDYLFMQVVIGEGRLSTSQNCGNILSGVLPYAIESGLIKATHPTTRATIHMLNSGGLCEVTVQTPNGQLIFAGDTKVDGVMGTGAPIICNYLDIAGANCGALLPTGKVIDIIDGIEVSCVDNGMPVVNIRATDLGITGYESKLELDANEELKKRLESIRLQIGPKMNLGDVSQKTVPKMSLISPPKNGGLVNTRTFIPHVCHAAVGVLGAVSAATGCLISGSVADGVANIPTDFSALSVEHPSGQFSVSLDAYFQGTELVIEKSGTLRTARIISKGEVYIPSKVVEEANLNKHKFLSLSDLLDTHNFRNRIGMYIGEKNINILRGFIEGYFHGVDAQNANEKNPLVGFNTWVADYYKWKESTAGWKNIILEECKNDKEKAVDKFFQLYDKFKTKNK